MEVRNATAADLKAMGSKSVSRGCLGELPETIEVVYALQQRGVLLGVGGVQLMNPTCAWVWLDLTADALKNWQVVYRFIRDYLDGLMADKGLTRLMAAVEESFPEAIRMVEHLGFERESRMAQWIGDRDAFMYVRLGKRGAPDG